MEMELRFVKEIASGFVSEEMPSESRYLDIVVEEMRRQDWSSMASNPEIPLALGADDILQALQSPAIVAVLISVWTNLAAPVLRDALNRRVASREDDLKLSARLKADLSKRKLKDYIALQGRKFQLDQEISDRLAERILDWIERHSDEIEHIT